MYDMGTAKFARVLLHTADGKDLSVRAMDIGHAEETTDGSAVLIDGLGLREVAESPSEIDTAVDAFWDAWLAAFPA
jgi:hypothetical protein